MGFSGFSAGLSKEVKQDAATWTSAFNTTNTTYVDVTNATVTISGLTASKTYHIKAFVSTQVLDSTNVGWLKLLIDGTNVCETGCQTTTRTPMNVSGMKKDVTGATSYIAKLQCKSNAGETMNVNDLTTTNSIIIEAVEQ